MPITKVPVTGRNGISRRIGGRGAVEIDGASHTNSGGACIKIGSRLGIDFHPSGIAGGLAVFGDGADVSTCHGHRAVRTVGVLVS